MVGVSRLGLSHGVWHDGFDVRYLAGTGTGRGDRQKMVNEMFARISRGDVGGVDEPCVCG